MAAAQGRRAPPPSSLLWHPCNHHLGDATPAKPPPPPWWEANRGAFFAPEHWRIVQSIPPLMLANGSLVHMNSLSRGQASPRILKRRLGKCQNAQNASGPHRQTVPFPTGSNAGHIRLSRIKRSSVQKCLEVAGGGLIGVFRKGGERSIDCCMMTYCQDWGSREERLMPSKTPLKRQWELPKPFPPMLERKATKNHRVG